MPKIDFYQISESLQFSASYFKKAFSACEDFFVIRYEDLSRCPVETIQGIGRHIGVEVPEEEAAAIWLKYIGRTLPGAPESHFRRGQVGGWLEDMDAPLVQELATSDSFRLLKCLGYGTSEEIGRLDVAAFRDAAESFECCEFMDRTAKQVGANVSRTAWVESPHGDTEIAESLRSRFDTPYFRLLCDSADHVADRQD